MQIQPRRLFFLLGLCLAAAHPCLGEGSTSGSESGSASDSGGSQTAESTGQPQAGETESKELQSAGAGGRRRFPNPGRNPLHSRFPNAGKAPRNAPAQKGPFFPGHGQFLPHGGEHSSFGPGYVENLRSDLFDDSFRDELKRFLGERPDGAADTPAANPQSQGTKNVTEIEEQPGEKTYATVLQEYEVGGRRTRVLLVRPARTPEGKDVQPLPPVQPPNPTGAPPAAAPVAASSAGANPFGNATLIRSRSASPFSAWGNPTTPERKREALEAELRFRQFDSQLETLKEMRASSKPVKAERKDEAASVGEPSQRTTFDQIVIIEEPSPDTAEPRRAMTSEASWDWQPRDLSWGTVAQSVSRMAGQYSPRVFQRMGFLGFASTAATVLLLLMLLHRKKRRPVAVRAYRQPVYRRASPPPPSAPRETLARSANVDHPFALLTDGRDQDVWEASYTEVPDPEALTEKEREAIDLLEEEFEEEEKPTVTGEIPGTEFRSGVQVSFDPSLCRWVIKKISPVGNPAEVLAVLQPGTVVRGAVLRSAETAQRFRLTPTGTWVPTNEPENLILAVSPSHFRGGPL